MSLAKVLSLDVSASSTGWSFTTNKPCAKVEYGLIKTKAKESHAERLVHFRKELIRLIRGYKPSHIVMEDVFSGPNAKTLVLLAKFGGVAQEVSKSVARVEPYIIHNNTVKAFFKVKNKEEVFNSVTCIMEQDWTFNKHNDITDATAQLLCYMDHILKVRTFRTEKPYGYLYGVNNGKEN